MWALEKKKIYITKQAKESKEHSTRHDASDSTNNKMPEKMSLPEGRPAEGFWSALSAWRGRVPRGERRAHSGVGNEIEDARDPDSVSPVAPL